MGENEKGEEEGGEEEERGDKGKVGRIKIGGEEKVEKEERGGREGRRQGEVEEERRGDVRVKKEREKIRKKDRERDPNSEAVQLTLLCCPTSSPGLGTMIETEDPTIWCCLIFSALVNPSRERQRGASIFMACSSASEIGMRLLP